MIKTIFCLGSKLRQNCQRPFLLFLCGCICTFWMSSVKAKENNMISVGTLNGQDIWLDDVLRAAERLPEEFQKAPLENYFSQIVCT